MTSTVLDFLESIKVEDEHGNNRMASFKGINGLFNSLIHCATVTRTGQSIPRRQVQQLIALSVSYRCERIGKEDTAQHRCKESAKLYGLHS